MKLIATVIKSDHSDIRPGDTGRWVGVLKGGICIEFVRQWPFPHSKPKEEARTIWFPIGTVKFSIA